VRWLVPRGERFANFDILNDNDTQLDYYRRFGHIYAVGIPARKWRLVVVSDPELLDQVASDEEQFGKRVEEINFFAQLANSRGGGLSVIGDGPHYERIRRVMLPWYSPAHQRTQLDRMKDQAGRLVAAWAALPDDEPLDARAWMERYTLEVSGRGACAYDFGLLASDTTSCGDQRDQRRDRRRAPAPVRGGRPGEHQGEHPAGGRPPPRLHPVRRGAPGGRGARSTAGTTKSSSGRPTRWSAPGCTPARSGRRPTCSAGW